MAGLWRRHPELGERFTLLTTEPGPDMAPYHNRQVVVLARGAWADWLEGASEAELLRPGPAGSLRVSRGDDRPPAPSLPLFGDRP
jgi:putative SOS response-associated peptidase YedK